MDLGGKIPFLMIGGSLIGLGVVVMRRAGRYDLKGAAWDSVSDVIRGRRTRNNPTALERKWQEIAQEGTNGGKARRAATTVIGHFFAQAATLVALIAIAAGSAIGVFGLFFR